MFDHRGCGREGARRKGEEDFVPSTVVTLSACKIRHPARERLLSRGEGSRESFEVVDLPHIPRHVPPRYSWCGVDQAHREVEEGRAEAQEAHANLLCVVDSDL